MAFKEKVNYRTAFEEISSVALRKELRYALWSRTDSNSCLTEKEPELCNPLLDRSSALWRTVFKTNTYFHNLEKPGSELYYQGTDDTRGFVVWDAKKSFGGLETKTGTLGLVRDMNCPLRLLVTDYKPIIVTDDKKNLYHLKKIQLYISVQMLACDNVWPDAEEELIVHKLTT